MDSSEKQASPRAPSPVYELEWETRTPKPKRASFLSGLLHSASSTTHQHTQAPLPAAAVPPPPREAEATLRDGSLAKETAVGSDPSSIAVPHPIAGTTTSTTAARPQTLRERLDAIVPLHRTYLGLRRRRFLLVTALTLLLFILVLAIGLGVGLSRRGGSSTDSLPLPGRDGGATHTGDLTFYEPGLGSCGSTHGSEEMIAAVSLTLYDAAGGGSSNPNINPLCGRRIVVSRDGHDDIEVIVVDRCTGCRPTDLDLSPAAFGKLAVEAEGRVVGRWRWL